MGAEQKPSITKSLAYVALKYLLWGLVGGTIITLLWGKVPH